MYFVPQVGENDCGFACLKILLATIHHDKSYLFLKQDENHGHYSFRDLVIIAKRNNAHLVPFRVEEKDEIYKCEHFPVIASFSVGKSKHAVLLKKINKRKAFIVDPSQGEKIISSKDFMDKWDGSGLWVDNFTKSKCEEKIIKPISDNKIAFANLLQFLSAICLVVGVYFLLPTNSVKIPLLFVSLSLIFEIAFRLYLYTLMKNMDDFFMGEIENVSKANYYDYFVRYEKYKSSLLTNSTSYVYYLFSILFVVFITILNGTSNLLLVIIPLVISSLNHLVIKPYQKKKNNEVQELENSLKDCQDDVLFEGLVKLTHDKAYGFSQFVLTKKIAEIIVLFIGSLLTCYISKSYSLINIAFYTCLELFLEQNLTSLLSFEEKRNELNLNKIKVANLIHQNDENE